MDDDEYFRGDRIGYFQSKSERSACMGVFRVCCQACFGHVERPFDIQVLFSKELCQVTAERVRQVFIMFIVCRSKISNIFLSNTFGLYIFEHACFSWFLGLR